MRLRLVFGLHLAQCRACRAYMRGLRRVSDLARQSLRGGIAPEALLRRLGLAEDDAARDTRGPDRADDPPPQERAHDDPPSSPRPRPDPDPVPGPRPVGGADGRRPEAAGDDGDGGDGADGGGPRRPTT